MPLGFPPPQRPSRKRLKQNLLPIAKKDSNSRRHGWNTELIKQHWWSVTRRIICIAVRSSNQGIPLKLESYR